VSKLEELQAAASSKAVEVERAGDRLAIAEKTVREAEAHLNVPLEELSEFRKRRDDFEFAKQRCAFRAAEARAATDELHAIESSILAKGNPKERELAVQWAMSVAKIVLRANDPSGIGWNFSRIQMPGDELSLWLPLAEDEAAQWYKQQCRTRVANAYVPVGLTTIKECPPVNALCEFFEGVRNSRQAERERKLIEARKLVAAASP